MSSGLLSWQSMEPGVRGGCAKRQGGVHSWLAEWQVILRRQRGCQARAQQMLAGSKRLQPEI